MELVRRLFAYFAYRLFDHHSRQFFFHFVKRVYLIIITISYLSLQLIFPLELMTLLLSDFQDKDSSNIRAFTLFTWTTCYGYKDCCALPCALARVFAVNAHYRKQAMCCVRGLAFVWSAELGAISFGSWLVWHKFYSTWLVFMSAEENVVITNIYIRKHVQQKWSKKMDGI